VSASTAEKGIRFRWRSRAGRGGLLAIWLLPVLAALWTVERAPDWLEPRQLTVELEPGQSLTLGREALCDTGSGSVVGASGRRRTHLAAPRGERSMAVEQSLIRQAGVMATCFGGRWKADPGVVADAGGVFCSGCPPFTVLGAENGRLILRDGDRRWEYDGLRLRRDGQLLPECRQDWRSRLREWLSSAELPFGWVQRPVRVGTATVAVGWRRVLR